MTSAQIAITVAAIALGTMLTRFIAFVVFPAGKEAPEFVLYLGKALPPAVFAMLLVYCLKDVDLLSGSHGLPEAIAMAIVVLLHLKWRQMLISVAGGTISYMLLIQLVFA